MSRLLLFLALLSAGGARAEETWSRPPPEVLAVLHAPELPSVWLSPTRTALFLATVEPYPPLAELARSGLKLAGVRIDPGNRSLQGESCTRALTYKDIGSGREQALALPPDACVLDLQWSADGARFALTNRADDGISLWLGDTATLKLRPAKRIHLNPMLGAAIQWLPDQRSLLVKAIPREQGAPPPQPATPTGPNVEETSGSAASSTYEARDLLQSPYDEVLFTHYATSQLLVVNASSGRATALGGPGLYGDVNVSPDGEHVLVQRVTAPYSHRVAWTSFPQALEIWNRYGQIERVFATLPAAETIPIDGVRTGPRSVGWRPTAPHTLTWIEALDGGDPTRAASHRDRLMGQDLSGEPTELHLAEDRVVAWWWGQHDLLMVEEYERERRWTHTWLHREGVAKPLFDHSARDHYADPGAPLTTLLPNGARVLTEEKEHLFFIGAGGSPEGDRPFLDQLDLSTGARQRLFQSAADVFEQPIDWLDLSQHSLLTRRESPTEVPNYHRRTLPDGDTPVTSFSDPTPQLRQIQHRIVTYTRADGVPLSFTLYLPPGYKEGTALPTVLTAYPFEYSDAQTAGQITGTDRNFLRLRGTSPLFLLLSGYAVLSNTAMPVIGDPDTAYDTFVEQVVSSASAAIDKAVALGVTDRSRVGVWGHSHGALMVATLLAHSDLFRAGIARSGAYNHTIRPFGFQNERRTLWEAKDTYLHLSPVLFAPQIKAPLLLIHGANDQNPGTLPFQSQRLYEAIRGTGGTARLVLLPYERHGYAALESTEQVLAEQVAWFDRWVKGPVVP